MGDAVGKHQTRTDSLREILERMDVEQIDRVLEYAKGITADLTHPSQTEHNEECSPLDPRPPPPRS